MSGSDGRGLAGVLFACVGFGTQCVFIKGKQIRAQKVDPLLVALLFSLSAAAIGGALFGALALLPGASCGGGAAAAGGFTRAGVLASLCFAPGNVLLLWVRLCGDV